MRSLGILPPISPEGEIVAVVALRLTLNQQSALLGKVTMSTFDPVVVLTTTPDIPTAQAIADRLLALKLCACVNIIPGAQSHFFWQGVFETSSESVCLIKTGRHLFAQIEEVVRQVHPYQVPEIIALPIVWGNADFLKWVEETIA